MSFYSDFDGLYVAGKARLYFDQFLFSDMNKSGSGVLPENLHAMLGVELRGPFILQVDEIVNISSSLKDRYHDAPAGVNRCLKLSMTDGVQQVFGMEYRPIRDLEVLAPAGLKVAIHDVAIQRGLLMLVPEVMEVLGGLDDDLDAARQRLVEEVNKPPRGKRNRSGEAPSLASRAQRAAWPSNIVNDHARANISTHQGTNPPHPVGRDTASLAASGSDEGERVRGDFAAPCSMPNAQPDQSSNTVLPNAQPDQSSNTVLNVEEMPNAQPDQSSNTVLPNARPDQSLNTVLPNARPYQSSNTVVNVEEMPNAQPDRSSHAVLHVEETHTIDEVEHPLILSGDKEIPFTYLACLLAKWTAKKDNIPFIQGKIKCFLTGVKGFQFRQRSTFELYVYVDDGSLISEILIDHKVVQKRIGHSPQEVTAALSSSDKKMVANMRETMKQYQLFLANFEGIMLVEINTQSPLPVALEMNLGCPSSDAWLLLRRLKSSTAPQAPRHHNLSPITISP